MMLWPSQDRHDVVIYCCDHPCEHPVDTSFLLVSVLKRNTNFMQFTPWQMLIEVLCGLKNTRVSFCSSGLLQQKYGCWRVCADKLEFVALGWFPPAPSSPSVSCFVIILFCHDYCGHKSPACVQKNKKRFQQCVLGATFMRRPHRSLYFCNDDKNVFMHMSCYWLWLTDRGGWPKSPQVSLRYCIRQAGACSDLWLPKLVFHVWAQVDPMTSESFPPWLKF